MSGDLFSKTYGQSNGDKKYNEIEVLLIQMEITSRIIPFKYSIQEMHARNRYK